MDTTSLWMNASTRLHTYPELSRDLEVDVVIIGGGITGVTAAFQLIKAGKTVALVEAHKIGGVTTGSSTGNLYIAVQPFYQSIYSKFDIATATAVAHSRKFAMNYIENNINEHGIQCQFQRRPWYAYTNHDERISLEKEVETFKKMDIPINYTKNLPLDLKFKKAVVMEEQARFNPLQYVISMTELLKDKGCQLFENTLVTGIEEKSECVVSTDKAKITARKVFIATHTPIGTNPVQMFTAPYRSYVVAVTLKDDVYPEGHFWDLDQPPHAICTHAISRKTPELLMVTGSHHKTGQGNNMAAHYDELHQFLYQHFAVDKIVYQWSAQHYQSADSIPYIGLAKSTSRHTYMATGYFADGLVYGTLAGIIMGDLLAEKETPFSAIYQSNRHTLTASASFLFRENLNVFFQYLKDFPLFSDSEYQNLKKGEGRVVEIDREKCAVSRDENNELHMVSAVCPHMKGIVNWNNAEQTWDCPCHGSRFTRQGKVIEGPATTNLSNKFSL